MNGPQHYREAEKKHQLARHAGRMKDGAAAVLYMSAAQFHATMAQAAAIAAFIPANHVDAEEWYAATAARKEGETETQ